MENQDNTWKAGLPQDLYASELETIQDVNFTRREIDIVSCLLSGKTAKQIASFLSISPRTVENHVRNIGLKTDCRTQAAIINFIEKSKQFPLVKNHYSTLLIQHTFAIELKKISKKLPKKSHCCIIYNKTLKNIMSFFSYFIHDLKLASIDISIENTQENDSDFHLPNSIQQTEFHAIFYYIRPEQTEDLQLNKIIQFLVQYSCRLIFISITNNTALTTPQKLPHVEMMILPKLENYYFFVFEVLKKLFPTVELEENISAFKQKQKIFFESFAIPVKQEKTKTISILNNLSLKKKVFLSTFGIISYILVGMAFYKPFNLFMPTKTNTITNNLDISLSRNPGSRIWNLPRQDNIFINRAQLLESLSRQLNASTQSNLDKTNQIATSSEYTSIVTICAGLGGVGKTQLALKYAHHFKGYTLKAWFYAENIAQLKQQYIDFAKMLGSQEANLSFESALSYIKATLSQYPGWLLIFDNVNNYKEINSFLPERGGHIIMTTRQRHWPNTFNMVEVNVMTEEEALRLIESIIFRKISAEEYKTAQKLIEKLGYLPLALAQASAYIRNNGISLKEYLERYDHAEQKMLTSNTMPEGAEHIPVSLTWQANLDAIKKEALQENIPQLSAILITLCAYLDPNQIPKTLLLSWLKKTYPNEKNHEWLLDQLLGQLNRYSLITLDSDKGTVDIHRLVQAVLRQQHKQIVQDDYYPPLDQAWYENILTVAHEEFTRKTSGAKGDQRQKALLPHLQSLINHYADLNLNPKSTMLALISFEVGVSLAYEESSLSKHYLEKSLEIFKQKHGENHQNVSRTLRYLGSIYCLLGDIKRAQELLEDALKIDEKIQSTEISNTLNNLGIVYGILGRVKEQSQLSARALKMDEQSPNATPHHIASRLHNLGTAYIASGEPIKGKSMLERSLEIYEKEYGQDYFLTATVLTSLGHAHWVLGDLNQAKVQLERSLKIKEKLYHPEHIAIGISLNNLGNVHRDLGDAKQSSFCLEKALEISEKHYGKDHIATAIVINNLGELYKAIQNTNESQSLFTRAREIKKAHKIDEISLNFATGYGALGDANHKKWLQPLNTAETQ